MERIPILRMGDFLLVTIQVDMHDRLAMTLQDDLTTRISQTGAMGVLIDISALEIVDSFIGRMIANISAMSRVLDAQTVIVGMQPAVAITRNHADPHRGRCRPGPPTRAGGGRRSGPGPGRCHQAGDGDQRTGA
jgi:anti-anti-sigma regulatory factor